MWIRRTRSATSEFWFCYGISPAAPNKYLHFGQRVNDNPTIGFWADEKEMTPAFADLAFGWHHFAFTYSVATRNRKVYVDGTLYGQDTSTAALNAPNKPISVRNAIFRALHR